MSVEQTRGIRDRSDAWKAFTEKKIKSTPWSTDENEMAKKTTLRRLLKRQDLSPEMRTAIEIEDRAEFPEMRTINAREDGPPPPPQIAQQSPPISPQEPARDAADLALAEAGRDDGREVIWDDEEAPPLPSARGIDAGKAAPSAADPSNLPTTAQGGAAKPRKQDRQPPPADQPEAFREWIVGKLEAAGRIDDVQAMWDAFVKPNVEAAKILPPDLDDLTVIFANRRTEIMNQ